MIHDLLFSEYCKNRDLSEVSVLGEAIQLYYRDTGQNIPTDVSSHDIDAAKRHFLNKLSTFTMDLQQPCGRR